MATVLAVALLLGSVMAGPIEAQQSYRFWWQVVDEQGIPFTGKRVLCSVYDPAVGNRNAVYHTNANLSVDGRTSPIAANDQQVHEIYRITSAPVDVVCWWSGGSRSIISRLDRFTHTILLDKQNFNRVSRFAFHSNGGLKTLTDVFIPNGAVIRDVIINNTSPVAGATHLNVGFAGNHAISSIQALVVAHALTATAALGGDWIRPGYVVSGNCSLILGCPFIVTRGVALARSHGNALGMYMEVPYVVAGHINGGLQVEYQAANVDGLNGHVMIYWQELHVKSNLYELTN